MQEPLTEGAEMIPYRWLAAGADQEVCDLAGVAQVEELDDGGSDVRGL